LPCAQIVTPPLDVQSAAAVGDAANPAADAAITNPDTRKRLVVTGTTS
jgi:hypothetical protein